MRVFHKLRDDFFSVQRHPSAKVYQEELGHFIPKRHLRDDFKGLVFLAHALRAGQGTRTEQHERAEYAENLLCAMDHEIFLLQA